MFNRQRKTIFSDTVSAPPYQTGPVVQTQTDPIPYHSLTVGVWIPIMQAIVTGLVIGLASGVFALLAHTGILVALCWFGGMFTASLVVVWLTRFLSWTYTARPPKLHYDTREEEPSIETIHVNLHHHDAAGNPTTTQRRTFSASRSQMETLALMILRQGKSFSDREMSGRGKPFSQAELKQLRGELALDNLVFQTGKGTNAAYEFTPDGLEMLAAFLPDFPADLSPLPRAGGRVTAFLPPSSTHARKY